MLNKNPDVLWLFFSFCFLSEDIKMFYYYMWLTQLQSRNNNGDNESHDVVIMNHISIYRFTNHASQEFIRRRSLVSQKDFVHVIRVLM